MTAGVQYFARICGRKQLDETDQEAMVKQLIKLLRMLDPRIAANGPSMLSHSAQEKWLDVIEKHGFEAHLYLPTIGHQDDQELWDALERLRLSGHIITDRTGSLVGKVEKIPTFIE